MLTFRPVILRSFNVRSCYSVMYVDTSRAAVFFYVSSRHLVANDRSRNAGHACTGHVQPVIEVALRLATMRFRNDGLN